MKENKSKTTKSNKRLEMRQNFDFRMEQKIDNASSHMLLDHCYVFNLFL